MSSADVQARIGQALVDFAAKSQYPDDEAVIAANVEGSALPIALKLLSNAKSSLEVGSVFQCMSSIRLRYAYVDLHLFLGRYPEDKSARSARN